MALFCPSGFSFWGRPALGPTALKLFEFQQRPVSHCPNIKQHPANEAGAMRRTAVLCSILGSFVEFFVSLPGEKFSSLLGPPSNEENAVEFQSVGLASSSWNLHCELQMMIAFTVTANCCAGKYAEDARKFVFGTQYAWLRSSQASWEAISFGTQVNNTATFPYVITNTLCGMVFMEC